MILIVLLRAFSFLVRLMLSDIGCACCDRLFACCAFNSDNVQDCSWDVNAPSQCFLSCVDNPSKCSTDLAAYSCPSGKVKCWSGVCQDDWQYCKPYPACKTGDKVQPSRSVCLPR